jgi:caa(3)-type oxidase subunit IV
VAEHSTPETAHGQAHASRSTYWLIALILGIITMLEVAVFYVPLLHSVIVPMLLVLSTAKFALVAMFFMHLKFDKPILTTLFAGGIVVATSIILAMMLLFGVIGSGAHM